MEVGMAQRTKTLAAAAAVVLTVALAVVFAPVANAAVGCRVSYVVTNQWSGGFTANVTVTNLGDPLDDWTLRLTFPDPDQYVVNSWPASFTQIGRDVIIVKPRWAGPLGTNQTFTVGLQGRGPAAPPPTATLNGVPCTGAIISPTPSRTPTRTPTPVADPFIDVALTSPAHGALFTAPGPVELAARANAAIPAVVSRVDFVAGTTVIGSDSSAPYTFSWTGVAPGEYLLRARAVDASRGLVFSSQAVSIIVLSATNHPPVVTLTDPTARPFYPAPAHIVLDAEAVESDPRDVVNRMDFFVGTTLVAQSASGSGRFARFTYDATQPGTYAFTVRAYDGRGGVGVSNTVTILVTGS
jgi:hypothetical protein